MTTRRRLTDEERAAEAARWNDKNPPVEWNDAPGAVPRTRESVAISIRIPKSMLVIIKEFASRQGIGYQVLIKKWLDERIRKEASYR